MKPELVGKENLEKKELTELQKLKIENFKLKNQLVQLDSQLAEARAQLNTMNLRASHASLEKEFRTQLDPPKDSVFNWDTMIFDLVNKVKEEK